MRSVVSLVSATSTVFCVMFLMPAASTVVLASFHMAFMMAGTMLCLTKRHASGEHPCQRQ
jgi:hypothetical protein